MRGSVLSMLEREEADDRPTTTHDGEEDGDLHQKSAKWKTDG